MKIVDNNKQIKFNIKVHDLLANKYEYIHKEIFNEIEQDRLFDSLEFCKKNILVKHNKYKALDFGCGTGNLTKHLINLDFEVTCSDISSKLLNFVKNKFKSYIINLILLNGKNLNNIPSNYFDFVGAYSVLHHIPDYLFSINEMIRVCKKDGIIFLDHERSPNYYKNINQIEILYKKISKFNLNKYLIFNNYISKFKRYFNPKFTNEGDIHIWPDDNINWDEVIDIFNKNNCEILSMHDYLTYSKNYDYNKFIQYHQNEKYFDTRMIVARKK